MGRVRALLSSVLLLLVATLGAGCGSDRDDDRLTTAVLAELEVFTDWLERNDARGFVGEVGWPGDAGEDNERWNEVAERWYDAADEAGLWVTNWATGEWWRRDYNLATYEASSPSRPVDTRSAQAEVVERHDGDGEVLRGINVAGGAFSAPSIEPTSDFSNVNPGAIDREYHYDRPETFRYVADRGMELVRIEFRWERLQPTLGGDLDGAELERVRGAADAARDAGMQVVIDMHNYGAYYLHDGARGVRRPIGSAEVSIEHFADVWRRLSQAFATDDGILAYGLMNEPVDMQGASGLRPPQVWERASQAAIDAIRSRNDLKLVMVSGYNYSGAQQWPSQHPRAWIRDRIDNFRYEAHHYWDLEHTSTYPRSYARELEMVARRSP